MEPNEQVQIGSDVIRAVGKRSPKGKIFLCNFFTFIKISPDTYNKNFTWHSPPVKHNFGPSIFLS